MLDLLAAGAVVAAEHGGEEHAEAAAFGIAHLTPGFFVALAMLVVFAIMLKARVPALIASALDARIAGIKDQLDTASKLRAEAEALKAEYEAKSAAADADIAALKAGAERQAAEIVAKAKDDAARLVERHQAMAEAKIGAAERAAIAEIRQTAATAASAAAETLIAGKIAGEVDKRLVDEAIAGI